MENGKELKVEAVRFVSIVRHEIGAIRYAVTPLNFAGELTVTPYLDGDVKNKDSNYDEKFWLEVFKRARLGRIDRKDQETRFSCDLRHVI